MPHVDALGAHGGAHLAGSALGSLAAFRVVDDGHEGAIRLADEAHESADGAELAAPFAEEHHLGEQERRHEDDAPGHVAEGEQAHDQHDSGEGEADGADEAEHGKTEDGRREQGAAQDDVAGIESRPLLGAGRAAVTAAGKGRLLVGGKRRGRVRGLRSLGGFHQGVILGGQDAGAGHVGVRRLLREDAADLRHHGHGAHPAAEGAGEQQDEGERDDDRDDRAGEQGLRGDHRRERAQGAQKRDVLPADGRQRAHAHMGGKAHADDADDGEGNDGAESLGIHEGTSFTTRGDGR